MHNHPIHIPIWVLSLWCQAHGLWHDGIQSCRFHSTNKFSSFIIRTPIGEQFPHELRHDKTNKVTVRPAKPQISLGIRPVWSESSLCAQWVAKDPSFLHADSEDSDQTGRTPRLIWVFAGRTDHFVGFVTRRLISVSTYLWLLNYPTRGKAHLSSSHQIFSARKTDTWSIIYNWG